MGLLHVSGNGGLVIEKKLDSLREDTKSYKK